MALSIVKDLVDRRVPQYLAIYLGASWATVEFFAFLEDRFLLSPHLTNLVLAGLVLLLPSVVLVTYFHGRRGPDDWSPFEKAFVPLNLLVTIVILFAGFTGKDLGAVTTRVTVEDEQGNVLERVVPKSEFRKRVALFPLEARSNDPAGEWIGGAVMAALSMDLFQDMFLDLRTPATFQEELTEAGFASARDVPDPLKRRIAGDLRLGYYVDGTAEQRTDGYHVAVALHDVERARAVAEHAYEGADLFAIVDSASVQIRRDLEIPTRHIEQSPDVPVSEILTADTDALRHFVAATEQVRVESDYETAIATIEEALTIDPGFATGHYAHYQMLALSGDVAGAAEAVRHAMDHSYRLPERLQFAVKAEWFAMQQDLPRAFSAYEMWAELYPQDIEAQLTVAQIRRLRNDRLGAIEQFERVLALDPTRLELLPEIGALYEALGDSRRARDVYERYADANPESKDAFTNLAGLYRHEGEHDRARALYDQALLVAPGDVDLMVQIASLDRDLGDFQASTLGYQRALDAARTPQQRHTALRQWGRLHEYRGSYHVALSYLERALAESPAFQPPVARIQERLANLEPYVHAGRTEEALTLLDSLSAQLPPPMDALVPLGAIDLYQALEQPEQLAAAVAEGEAMLERSSLDYLRQPVIWGRGRLHEIRGEWEEAISAYEEERRLSPMDPTIPLQLGRCYRAKGELQRALTLVLESLETRPSSAPSHLEAARIYRALGRPADAIRHVERALETWEPADAGYEPASEARALLAELTGEEGG
jgi:tetratricopeptide (TPR) repeat protein